MKTRLMFFLMSLRDPNNPPGCVSILLATFMVVLFTCLIGALAMGVLNYIQ